MYTQCNISCCIEQSCQIRFIACAQDLKMLTYTANCTRWKSQSAWLYTSNYAGKTLSRTLLSMLSHALLISLGGTPQASLTVCSRVTAQDPLNNTASKCAPMYAPGWSIQRLNELPVPDTRGQVVGGGLWWLQSWHLSISLSEPYFELGHLEEISQCLTVMVLTIEAWHSAGKVDNWIKRRADLWLRFSGGLYCSLLSGCGCKCTHLWLMVMMAMVMIMMIMVLVMVIIVSEALRQVSWLHQC